MFSWLSKLLHNIHIDFEHDNIRKCLSLCEKCPSAVLLDCGCGHGDKTLEVASAIKTNSIYGIEIKEVLVKESRMKGIECLSDDLNQRFPFADESFDVVFSNQVIEHLKFIDGFIKEIHRVLKPAGYCVVSSENLSSWDNIFSLIMGWRPFSADFSDSCYIGNPMAPGYKGEITPGHTKVPTYRAFKEIFELHHFKVEKIVGAGYSPLQGKVSSFLSCLDPRHARFIIVKARKMRRVNFGTG